MELFRILKNASAKANTKINELWQSQDENLKNVRYLMVISIIGIIMIFIKPNDDDILHTIGAIIILYLAMWCCFVSVAAGLTYLYVFGRKKHKQFCVRLFRFTYKLILLLLIITSIPCIIILFLIGITLGKRARKIDNIIYLSFFMLIIISILSFLYPINDVLIETILKHVDGIFTVNNINYNSNFVKILLLILISMVEINTFTKLGLRIIKKNRLKKIKKSEFQKLSTIDSEECVKYDLNYFEKSIWRFELIGLIFLFIGAAATKNIFPNIETEVKDAATVVTLGMLYWDKRKEWK